MFPLLAQGIGCYIIAGAYTQKDMPSMALCWIVLGTATCFAASFLHA